MAESGDKRIIAIAMDGSDFALFAFDWYIKNFHKKNDHVILIYCPEFMSLSSITYPMEAKVISTMYKEEQNKVDEFTNVLGDKLKAAGIGGKVRCQTGKPGEVIVKVAEEENAMAIVTGCRGLGTIRRTFMGSVSDYVIHHSNVPVIVCRHKDPPK